MDYMVHTGFIGLYVTVLTSAHWWENIPHGKQGGDMTVYYCTQTFLAKRHEHDVVRYRIDITVWYCINICWYTELL